MDSEGEASPQAQAFKESPDSKAHRHKDKNAARAVDSSSVKESKCCRRKYVQHNDQQSRHLARKWLKNPRRHVENEEQIH